MNASIFKLKYENGGHGAYCFACFDSNAGTQGSFQTSSLVSKEK